MYDLLLFLYMYSILFFFFFKSRLKITGIFLATTTVKFYLPYIGRKYKCTLLFILLYVCVLYVIHSTVLCLCIDILKPFIND